MPPKSKAKAKPVQTSKISADTKKYAKIAAGVGLATVVALLIKKLYKVSRERDQYKHIALLKN